MTVGIYLSADCDAQQPPAFHAAGNSASIAEGTIRTLTTFAYRQSARYCRVEFPIRRGCGQSAPIDREQGPTVFGRIIVFRIGAHPPVHGSCRGDTWSPGGTVAH